MTNSELNDQEILLFVLNGVIVGMAVAKLISSYSHFLENKERYIFYWVQLFLSAIVFIMLVQYWFYLPQINNLTHDFWTYVYSLLYPLSLYLVSSLLMPDTTLILAADQKFDLKDYYYKNSKWIYGVVLVGLVLAFANKIYHSGDVFSDPSQLIRLSAIVVSSALFFSSHRRLHEFSVITLFAIMLLFLYLEYGVLTVR